MPYFIWWRCFLWSDCSVFGLFARNELLGVRPVCPKLADRCLYYSPYRNCSHCSPTVRCSVDPVHGWHWNTALFTSSANDALILEVVWTDRHAVLDLGDHKNKWKKVFWFLNSFISSRFEIWDFWFWQITFLTDRDCRIVYFAVLWSNFIWY